MNKKYIGTPYLNLDLTGAIGNKIDRLMEYEYDWVESRIITIFQNRIVPAYEEAKIKIESKRGDMILLKESFQKELDVYTNSSFDIGTFPESELTPWMKANPEWKRNLYSRVQRLELWIEQLTKHLEPCQPISIEELKRNVSNFFQSPVTDLSTEKKSEVCSIINYKYIFCNQLNWIVKNTKDKPVINSQDIIEPSEYVKTLIEKTIPFLTEEGQAPIQVEPFEWISIAMKDICFCLMSADEYSLTHGSFIPGVLNPRCQYSDVDFYSPIGGLLLGSLSVLGYLVGLGNFSNLVVPYIKNYITLKDDYNLSVFDCCVYTKDFLQSIPRQKIANFNTVDSIITFVNVFRSGSVKDRRTKSYKNIPKTTLNLQVLLEHIVQTKNVSIKGIIENRNKLFKYFMTKVVKLNSKDKVVFDIHKFYPNKKEYHVIIGSHQTLIDTCKTIPGKYSRTFESILDETWFENQSIILGTHTSLETETDETCVLPRSLVSMLWSLCLYSFLHKRQTEFNNLFVFLLGVSSSDHSWEVAKEIIQRTKNQGKHFGWSLKQKTFRGFVGVDLHPPSRAFIDKTEFINSVDVS